MSVSRDKITYIVNETIFTFLNDPWNLFLFKIEKLTFV